MNRALQRYLEAASGISNLTTAKAEQVVKGLVRSGEAASEQAETLVRDLIDRQQRNHDAVVALVKSETTRAVRAMGLATGTEVERLQKQVADLKRELTRVERDAATAPPSGTSSAATDGTPAEDDATAEKRTAEKAAEESTAKKATKKSTAKKATKKATAKKSTAKKATKKATAKKGTAKKSTAKKGTAKKGTAKKSTAKKATKKATAKKATRKSTAKKATKKSTAKKASDDLSPSATSDGVTADEGSS